MSILRRILREPLLHFAVAGGVIFAGYGWMSGVDRQGPGEPVHIGAGEIDWLRETFSSQWRRNPNSEELAALVETLVKEQLLAREARDLGLDRDDTIVRRRLAQKLTFLVEDTARIADPPDADLRAFYAAHAERYRAPARISFRQSFFSSRRRANAAADAASALQALSPSEEPVGDASILDDTFPGIDPAAAASLFGSSFADAVFQVKPGTWSGPLRSAYGVHLVLVTAIDESRPRSFDDVRTSLLDDWRRQKAQQASDAFLARLRTKHGVVIDDIASPRVTLTSSAPVPTP